GEWNRRSHKHDCSCQTYFGHWTWQDVRTKSAFAGFSRTQTRSIAHNDDWRSRLSTASLSFIRRPDRSRAKLGAVEEPSINDLPLFVEARSLRYAPSALRSRRRVKL